MTDRPLIAIDIKLKHRQDPETGELVLPEEYETEFAFRDRYQVYNRYVDAVYEHGGMPLMVPPIVDEDLLQEYVDMSDAFLCVGVNDYPPEIYREPNLHTNVQDNEGYRRLSETNMIMARMVLEDSDRMPTLGICAGPELFNIALGGKLVQHVPNAEEGHIAHSAIRDRYHEIAIVEGSIMADLFGAGRIEVNSNHHQAADPDHMGEGLWATAFSDEGVVEALESEADRFVLGVQWHPERIRDAEHRAKVFGAFIEAAREYRDGS